MRTFGIIAAIAMPCMSGAIAADGGVDAGLCKKWPLQERIDAIAAEGGGTLVLTAGVYRTGALFFRPGVNLRLEKGAKIVGVDDADGYPMRETRIEGETCLYYPALINADCCNGFTISGEGVIDGHGANTWEEFWTRLAEARKNGVDFRNKDLMRPRVLYVSRSKNVDVSGVTFKNSKFWTTHFYDCEDVTVHDCAILADVLKDSKGNELRGPSTDAIDIDKCRRFTIRNVDISVNDDGVVVKGGKGAWADDYAKFPGNGPSTDVLVENCTFRHPTHSALTLGSECPAATNVTMRNCVVDGCGDLLYLKMRTDTPQRYSNVLVEHCRGRCAAMLHVQAWEQYHDSKGRTAEELKSHADGIVLRNNIVKAKREKDITPNPAVYELSGLVLEGNVFEMEVAKNDPKMSVSGIVVTNGLKWIDGMLLPIEGRAFDDTEHYYDRLPAGVTTNVNGGVRGLKHHTSGMMFRFSSDSCRLAFKWVPLNDGLSRDHMPSTGVSGIDVYRFDAAKGRWRYVKTGRIYDAEKGGSLEVEWSPGTPCLVNLPLGNGLKSFSLGVETNATVVALGPRKSGVEKPVVFYGTSITHGYCSSRPGMGFVNIVGRDLDVSVVNLGFSGSGVMEFEMSEHLARIDASCYVLDCLANMGTTKGGDLRPGRNIEENYEPFIRNLRAKRPDVPIVMAERPDVYCRAPDFKDNYVKTLYGKLVAEGWSNLVYLPKAGMFADDFEGTVDGVHPNDWGAMSLARAYGKAVKTALGLDKREQ